MGRFPSRSRIVAAVLAMAVLAGCGSSNPRPAARFVESCLVPQAAPLKTHVHGNGLQLSVSETCKVTITSAGFVVEPPDWRQLRYPFKVSIQLQTAPPKVKRQVHYLGSGRFLWYSATSEGDQGASGAFMGCDRLRAGGRGQ
jgi:hypothetical protein